MSQEVLLYTQELQAAKKEIESLGGRVTQQFTKKRVESPALLSLGMKTIGSFNCLTQLGKCMIYYFYGKSNDYY